MKAQWLRVHETHKRWHAVYGQAGDSYVTVCGRRAPADTPVVEDPPAQCGCCRSRLAHPYLIRAPRRKRV